MEHPYLSDRSLMIMCLAMEHPYQQLTSMLLILKLKNATGGFCKPRSTKNGFIEVDGSKEWNHVR